MSICGTAASLALMGAPTRLALMGAAFATTRKTPYIRINYV
jgi:hypothetical protein